jgi:hypothetical protein
MATLIEYVEKQWQEWQDKNPPSSFEHIDEEKMKEILIKDLEYVSKMDVREYTLYQKWCEIKEKYPTREVSNLFGTEIEILNKTDEKRIIEIKKNIWIPKNPDDFMNLEPVLEYTDDSKVEIEERLFGEAKVVTKRSDLPEVWNTIRDFISTMKNNSNIGRNLNFIVKDNKTKKYLGVICISSDFLDLTPRDNAIGWSRDVKTQEHMINHTAIGSTIVPLQPLGFNYMGGKLLALLCLSDTVQKLWKEKYGDVLVGVTTTSLYGKTKAGGLSQYDGLEHWKSMGFSSGSVAFEPSRATKKLVFDWIKENHTRKYFEWWEAKNTQGLPLKRDHKNRSLNFAYSKLQIPKEKIRTEHQRGIYFSPLYFNTNEFLRKEISEDRLLKMFDTSEESLANIWKTKYAKGRIRQLQKKNNVSYDSLFYDDLIKMSWEETKANYLPQVGR